VGHRPPSAGTGAHLNQPDHDSAIGSRHATTSSKLRRNAFILGLVFLFPLVILSALFLFRRSSLQRSAADPAIFDAQSSAKMVALLGVPMQPGWPIHGTLVTHKGFGSADLRIPLAGPRGQGTLVEWAQRRQAKWHICSLVFHASNGTTLILVEDNTTDCERE